MIPDKNTIASPTPSVPVRTCIGCRERVAQRDLVRFNLKNGVLTVVNPNAITQGRSVYVCPREKCFDSAFRTGAIMFKRSKHDRIVVKMNGTECYILKNRFSTAVKQMFESACTE